MPVSRSAVERIHIQARRTVRALFGLQDPHLTHGFALTGSLGALSMVRRACSAFLVAANDVFTTHGGLQVHHYYVYFRDAVRPEICSLARAYRSLVRKF